jgi:hypothetical protein
LLRCDPLIGGFLAAGGAKPAFTAERNFLGMKTGAIATVIQRITPDQQTTAQQTDDVFDNRRT